MLQWDTASENGLEAGGQSQANARDGWSTAASLTLRLLGRAIGLGAVELAVDYSDFCAPIGGRWGATMDWSAWRLPQGT